VHSVARQLGQGPSRAAVPSVTFSFFTKNMDPSTRAVAVWEFRFFVTNHLVLAHGQLARRAVRYQAHVQLDFYSPLGRRTTGEHAFRVFGSTTRPHMSHTGSLARGTVLCFGRVLLFFRILPSRIRPGLTHRFLPRFSHSDQLTRAARLKWSARSI
jgi:hypothetical protein